MTWYRIKLASAAKVQQLKITDPFMKMLVMKYSGQKNKDGKPLIPWDKVKTQPQLISYIESTMLPEIKSRMDHNNPKNYYLKKVDVAQEFQAHPDDPNVLAAFQMAKTDPDKASKMLIEMYNADKAQSFRIWWDLMETNYPSNPCFKYCILDSVFKTSTEETKTDCIPDDADIIAEIHDFVKQGNTAVNIISKYWDTIDKNSIKLSYINNKGDGWVLIPSKKHCEENPQQNGTFNNSIKKLRSYGKDALWCVARDEHARTYLSGGDFYILTVDKRARVAIRMKNQTIAEIRGKNNLDQHLFTYWAETNKFLDDQNIPKDNSYYAGIVEKIKLNEDFVDPEKRKKILTDIDNDPAIYAKLIGKNRVGEAFEIT